MLCWRGSAWSYTDSYIVFYWDGHHPELQIKSSEEQNAITITTFTSTMSMMPCTGGSGRSRRRRSTRTLGCTLIAVIHGSVHSFAPSHRSKLLGSPTPTTSCLLARPRPSSSNWEDEFSSSRNNPYVQNDTPPWREHETTNNSRNDGTGKEGFQQRSTDDFKVIHILHANMLPLSCHPHI